ncbi:uncharacterized protein RJT20DRAFT_124649 [Scheffersomyces xylosifermentans]|uniref:uncharacterized protein n=1 Tax=Scheffersomyces xylosifermentans TaxID=1304137 RepID=UPI00315D9873
MSHVSSLTHLSLIAHVFSLLLSLLSPYTLPRLSGFLSLFLLVSHYSTTSRASYCSYHSHSHTTLIGIAPSVHMAHMAHSLAKIVSVPLIGSYGVSFLIISNHWHHLEILCLNFLQSLSYHGASFKLHAHFPFSTIMYSYPIPCSLSI